MRSIEEQNGLERGQERPIRTADIVHPVQREHVVLNFLVRGCELLIRFEEDDMSLEHGY